MHVLILNQSKIYNKFIPGIIRPNDIILILSELDAWLQDTLGEGSYQANLIVH